LIENPSSFLGKDNSSWERISLFPYKSGNNPSSNESIERRVLWRFNANLTLINPASHYLGRN